MRKGRGGIIYLILVIFIKFYKALGRGLSLDPKGLCKCTSRHKDAFEITHTPEVILLKLTGLFRKKKNRLSMKRKLSNLSRSQKKKKVGKKSKFTAMVDL